MKTEIKIISEPIKTSAILKTIFERRAVRKYKEYPVDRKIIEQIIDAGRMAPSAMNKQSWKFYVLTNKDIIQSFSKEIMKVAARDYLKNGLKQIIKTAVSLLHSFSSIDFFKADDPVFHGAPVVIVITAPRFYEWAGLDIGMCSQNMMLAAKSLGLDSCPVGLGKYLEHTKNYSLLHTSPSEQVQLAIIFGYGNESPEVHKRTRNNVTFID